MTQVAMTLQALKQAGNVGVHSFTLNKIVGTIRGAARIDDLKRMGYQIFSQPEKMGYARGVRYFLLSSPKELEKPQYRLDPVRQVYVQL